MAREPRPILQAGHAEAGASAGFTLIEVVCVLAITALMAAILLPALPFGTTHQRLEGFAIETAALLNSDQVSARRQHRDIATVVDGPSRTIRSGASGWVIRLPSDVTVEGMFAARCQDRPAGDAIHHLASGMSCGGVIALTQPGGGYQIKVNWLTGGAEIAAIH